MSLTYELIRAAQGGDPVALQRILRHYNGYIRAAASESIFDGYAHTHFVVNTEIQELIEAELLAAVLQWKEKARCKNT